MGYSDTSKSYRVQDLTKDKIVITHDAIFHKVSSILTHVPNPSPLSFLALVTVYFPSPPQPSLSYSLLPPSSSASFSHYASSSPASPTIQPSLPVSSAQSIPSPSLSLSTSPDSQNPTLPTRLFSDLLAAPFDNFTKLIPKGDLIFLYSLVLLVYSSPLIILAIGHSFLPLPMNLFLNLRILPKPSPMSIRTNGSP
jgi:hypothetical protein